MLSSMEPSRSLATLSAAQLACGLAGYYVAVNRGHPYDVLGVQGREDRVGRDSVLIGTAMSAPVTMLVTQGAMTVVLADGPNRRAQRVLGTLGAAMVAGYLGERLVRLRLTHSGWDKLESPIVIAGITLAAAMASVGLRTG